MTAVLARISLPLIALITASAAVVSTGGLVAEARQARSTPPPARDAEPRVIPLWDGPAPGALGTEDVDQPTLTYYPPAARQAGTTAVIIAPGGSYVRLSMNHEGRQVASLLNAMGVSAFVLKYRLGPRYRHPVPVGDARRAVRLYGRWRLTL